MSRKHEPKLPVRLSRRHERWLYAISGVLFASGLGWLITHYFFAGKGEFADMPNPAEPWWLRAHGAAMMGFLITLGSLLPGHVARAWQVRRNHRSGILMLACIALLLLTGYGLYYASEDQTRAWISVLHWGAGLAAAFALPLHVALGKSRSAARRAGNASARSGTVIP